MVALNFNAATVKPNAGFEPVPSGLYPVIITATEEKPTKNGKGSYLQITMTIQGGEHNGKTVIDRLNLRNENQQAVDIAYATLSAICHVTGRMQIQDSQQLHGAPLQVLVNKVERNDSPGNFSNEVKGYKDMNGNDPGFAGTVAQPGAQPQWAAQPAANAQQSQAQQPEQQPQVQQPQGGQPASTAQPSWAQQPQGGAQPAAGAPAWAQQPQS